MIEIDDKDLDRAAKMLEDFPGAIDKVSKKAVRAAVKGVKREAIDKITERYTIQKSRVGGTMRVSYQGSGAVFSSRGPVNDLSYFKHNPRSVLKHRPPKGKYLYSQVVKGQGGTIAHAFLARMRSGHVGVFERTGKNADSVPSYWRPTWGWGANKGKGVKEGIKKLSGPSTPQMLGSPTIQSYMERRLTERFGEALDKEVTTFLGGLRL